jgi:homoserine O-succinyltransferase/O-acetyltransferase
MPVVIDGGRIPDLLSRNHRARSRESLDRSQQQTAPLRVALINNMPDAALEDTEVQFFELLERAAGDIPVSLRLFSLPLLPRAEAGQRHLKNFYSDIRDLLNDHFDGVIVTGTEPRQPDLRNEPYWSVLTDVLDWAESNTTSTVLSCLAAHAGVLYSEGISRHRLADKQFGVFEYKKARGHALTEGIGEQLRIPHSRWNEVRGDALTSAGYEVLTQSSEAGVDLFVKNKKGSLFVHFQGHPEYGTRTLLKEYRRDIKRFLRHERETFPTMPRGYFDPAATKLVADFCEQAVANPTEEALSQFPEAAISGGLQHSWGESAATVYRNWLQYLISKKANAVVHPAVTPALQR